MKVTNTIFTILLAVASIERTAVADPGRPDWHGECYRAGEPCSKLKRAADAAAEATADGQNCDELRIKRDALALAEATAEAYAAADPEARPCHAPGAPCSKAKRQALNECENAPITERDCKLIIVPSTDACMLTPRSVDKAWHGYCHGAGETCSKLKRAAEVVAESVAQPNQTYESGK